MSTPGGSSPTGTDGASAQSSNVVRKVLLLVFLAISTSSCISPSGNRDSVVPAGIASTTAASSGGMCATHNEYHRLHEGMWRHRVNLIFGFIGDTPAQHHDGLTTRWYVGCVGGTATYVDFHYRRVVGKTWTRHE